MRRRATALARRGRCGADTWSRCYSNSGRQSWRWLNHPGDISNRRCRRLIRRRSRGSRATIPDGFCSAGITLTISLPAIRHRHLDDLSVNATPTEFPTMPQRFFSGAEASAAPFLAFRCVDQDDVSVDATPTEIFTVPQRFFSGRIALTLSFPAFRWRDQDNLPVDAAPTLRRRRRWSRCRAMNRRRTRKWKPPTRWRLRRTRRVIAGRAVPSVATAIFFPPPAAALLNPNPLAALIVPLTSRYGQRRQHKRVLVAVVGDSVADDDARIAYCSRDRQNLEIALGKIAQRIEIEHLIADIKKGVFGIIAGG